MVQSGGHFVFTPLGPESAVVLGRWQIKARKTVRADAPPSSFVAPRKAGGSCRIIPRRLRKGNVAACSPWNGGLARSRFRVVGRALRLPCLAADGTSATNSCVVTLGTERHLFCDDLRAQPPAHPGKRQSARGLETCVRKVSGMEDIGGRNHAGSPPRHCHADGGSRRTHQ